MYTIQKLHALHKEIIRAKAMGAKNVDIAKALGVTPVMVGYVLHSPAGKQQLDILMGARDAKAIDVRDRLDQMQPVALEVLVDMLLAPMEEVTPNVRKDIAQDLLDRGTAVPKINKSLHVTAGMRDEDLERIKKRAEEYEREEVREAEYSEVPSDV